MKKNSVDSFLKQAANSGKTDPQAVKDALNTGDISKLTASLSKEDMAKVQAVLSDKQKMQEILNSPLGKSFLKQFGQ